MNQLITDLIEQSKCFMSEHPEDYEEFAKLVVQECASWINYNVGLVDEEAKADLLKHFGVEE